MWKFKPIGFEPRCSNIITRYGIWYHVTILDVGVYHDDSEKTYTEWSEKTYTEWSEIIFYTYMRIIPVP